jgi:mannitol-specific phosphotransferase system IIBC component
MEPKVILETLKNSENDFKNKKKKKKNDLKIESKKKKNFFFNYDQKNIFFKQGGSGNNWGFGYSVHGPNSYKKNEKNSKNLTNISEILRKEIEKCDYFYKV